MSQRELEGGVNDTFSRVRVLQLLTPLASLDLPALHSRNQSALVQAATNEKDTFVDCSRISNTGFTHGEPASKSNSGMLEKAILNLRSSCRLTHSRARPGDDQEAAFPRMGIEQANPVIHFDLPVLMTI